MTIINEYTNGNTSVKIYDDGTKIREYEGEMNLVFPESLDVKISDYCNMGCKYCHESSTTQGKHGNLSVLLKTLKELPAGVEIAVGGGDALSHPDLIPFLHALKEQGLIANITINQGHLKEYQELIKHLIKSELVKGVGISITSNNFKYIKALKKLSNNIVYHVIAGVNKIEIMDKLIKIGNAKILTLGYKQFGFGEKYYSDDIKNEIQNWYMYLPRYIGKAVLSFDNLAIEQLNINRLFTTQGWNKFFMGNDFTHSMYLDGVKQQYAPTSRSKDRKSFNDYSLLEYFETFKEKNRILPHEE